jgi:hypothetical protein
LSAAGTGWTTPATAATIGGMGKEFRIEKLSDEFGQYELFLKCESCLHERRTSPHKLANICGWDAKLNDVVRRMRCSTCGKKKCTARVVPLSPGRGHRSH